MCGPSAGWGQLLVALDRASGAENHKRSRPAPVPRLWSPPWTGEAAFEPLARTASAVLALQRFAGNRAVSFSLRALAIGPVVAVQRDALPTYKSTDPVAELKPVINAKNDDAWQLTLEGDFSTPRSSAASSGLPANRHHPGSPYAAH